MDAQAKMEAAITERLLRSVNEPVVYMIYHPDLLPYPVATASLPELYSLLPEAPMNAQILKLWPTRPAVADVTDDIALKWWNAEGERLAREDVDADKTPCDFARDHFGDEITRMEIAVHGREWAE